MNKLDRAIDVWRGQTERERAWEKIQKLQAENAKLKAQLTWRPASELPEEDQIVIATYLNSYGKRRRVMAVYIRQYEEEAGDDDELCVEYCHEKDEWYLKEGWYELIDNWDYSSAAIVEGVVDYWMPMPPAPDTQLRQLAEDGGNLE